MTNQDQPPDQQFNTDELGGLFGEPLSRAYVRIILLEKQRDILLANEAAILAQVANLEAEIDRLTKVALNQAVSATPPLSPASAALAEAGRAVIQDEDGEKEKAGL